MQYMCSNHAENVQHRGSADFSNWNRFVEQVLKQRAEEQKKPARLPDQRQEAQNMTEQAKEQRRAYKREWNRRNPERVRQAQVRYWERKAAAAAAQAQQTDEQAQEA